MFQEHEQHSIPDVEQFCPQEGFRIGYASIFRSFAIRGWISANIACRSPIVFIGKSAVNSEEPTKMRTRNIFDRRTFSLCRDRLNGGFCAGSVHRGFDQHFAVTE